MNTCTTGSVVCSFRIAPSNATIGAAPSQPWYTNTCVTNALLSGAGSGGWPTHESPSEVRIGCPIHRGLIAMSGCAGCPMSRCKADRRLSHAGPGRHLHNGGLGHRHNLEQRDAGLFIGHGNVDGCGGASHVNRRGVPGWR